MPKDTPIPRSLHIETARQTGGIERAATRLAKGLIDAGGDVLFAASQHGATFQTCGELGIPTTVVEVKNSADIKAALTLAGRIETWQPAIVHVHSRRDYVPATMALAIARSRGALHVVPRLVFHHHMMRPLGQPHQAAGWMFQKSVDRVIAVSDAVKNLLEATHHVRPGFVDVIYNGIDTSLIQSPLSHNYARVRADARIELGLCGESVVIGMMGRLDTKGQDRMIRVLPRLLAVNDDIVLVLLGREGESGARAMLAAIAASLGVRDRVRFVGHVDNSVRLLPAFDLLAHLPSDEAFGLAVIEAQAAGLPVVASAIGGCREVVTHGKTGVLVDLDDNLVEAAFVPLVDPVSGQSHRRAFSKPAIDRVNRHFSLKSQIESVTALYRELQLSGTREAAPLGVRADHVNPLAH